MREDERLTSPTNLSSQLPSNIRVTDPDRSARIARGRANFAAHEARRAEIRRDYLHTLYMNAGDFITDRARANALVASEFDDKTKFSNGRTYGENIWHTGYPKTIAERFRRKMSVEEGLQEERVGRLAQALTGGKMRKP